MDDGSHGGILAQVLIVSMPRSGSTWLARVLGAADDVALCEEPDNHWKVPFAFRAKRSLPGRFHPHLAPDARPADYTELWRSAFGRGRQGTSRYTTRERMSERAAVAAFRVFDRGPDDKRSRVAFLRRMQPGPLPWNLALAERLAIPRRVRGHASHAIVKSVYASLSAEWIATQLAVAVIVLLRDPYAVISSWAERGWLGAPGDDMLGEIDDETREALERTLDMPIAPPGSSSVFVRAAYFYVLCLRQLLDAAERHPEWQVVQHQSLIADPQTAIKQLADNVGLPWSPASTAAIAAFDRPGRGFEPARTRDQLNEGWRGRLTPDQIGEIRTVLERTGTDARLA